MKIGKYKRFNKLCGIAKIIHETEEMYIAYSDYMIPLPGDLGTIVGKGKTEVEALRMALVNLTTCIKKTFDKANKFHESMAKSRLINNPLNFDDKPIISVEGWTTKEIDGMTHWVDSGEFYNADVRIDEDGDAFLGLC